MNTNPIRNRGVFQRHADRGNSILGRAASRGQIPLMLVLLLGIAGYSISLSGRAEGAEPVVSDSAEYKLGRKYMNEKRYEEAISAFEAAVKAEPSSARYQSGLGVAYISCGKMNRAVESFERAVKCDPAYMPAQKNLVVGYHLQLRIPECLAACNAFLAHENDVNVTMRRAWCHHTLSNPAGALRDSNTVLSVSPDRCDALGIKALALCNMGRFVEARAAANEILKLDTKFHVVAHFAIGNTLMKEQKIEGALVEYNKAIKADPREPHPYANRALC